MVLLRAVDRGPGSLPRRYPMDDAAKDMGLWHMSLTVPQLLATPTAGWLLDTFNAFGKQGGRPTLGYTVIFSVAIVYFGLGTLFVARVKKAH